MPHEVALVDDHHMMRAGLAAMVNAMGAYRVSIEAANGRELIANLSDASAEPAIAIVDLHMPVMDGYETIAWLCANRPAILPLALTFDPSDDAMVRAVRVGARGFVRKSARPTLLRTALDSLVLTGYYHSEEVHDGLTRSPGLRTREERERERVLAEITPREMEFLQLVCAPEEFTYDRIAERMGVHRSTVDKFRESLFDKFGIKSKTGLVLFAVRHGVAGF
jgi:two-component system invasion response regulator UvrY